MPETLTLEDKLKRLPRKPGVYLFKDAEGQIVYIGKAKILRNRVRSYFQSSDRKDFKTRRMIPKIKDLDWIVMPNEIEALISEQDLVRHHQPRYNILLKDDKSYPFIMVTREPYPQVLITRRVKKDGARYMGPYTDVKRLRETLQVLHKIFPIRSCTYHITDDSIREQKHRVCLDYHIKRCLGPCEGLQSEANYNAMITHLVSFLRGRTDEIIAHLTAGMQEASDDLRFEDAARIRNQFQSIQHYAERQSTLSKDTLDRDILAVEAASSYGVGVVLRVRAGKLIGKEKFDLTIADQDENVENFYGFLKQYYSQADYIPAELLVHEAPETHEQEQLEGWLSQKAGRRVAIHMPRRGEKVRLMRLARQNATLMLNEIKLKKAKRQELVPSSVERLQEDLGLEVPPRRIEGFDNSNIQGTHPVSSMVSFLDGKPRKSEYRKYNIKTVDGADDFASIYEVVSRRYRRVMDEGGALPDLVLIDGGKGQLSMAKAALNDLGLAYVPVIGLAKRLEEVYRPGHAEPYNIPKHSPGLSLLRRVRDEAHRFAITFHRQKRSKAMTASVLDDVPGVGPKRLRTIWKTFSSLEDIAATSPDDIAAQAKIPIAVAEAIYKRANTVIR
ncbi:MAG: excinuclease ABC subunit C [Candidatus Marinimicrobia bacterium]|nr:excinuclease ABC subunit C [Candidatus Neomarinimicrobiota bacterium]